MKHTEEYIYLHINIFHICLHIFIPLFLHIFPGVKLTATKLDFLPQSRLFSHRLWILKGRKKSYEMREELEYVLVQQLSRIIFPSSMHIHIRSVIHYYRLGVPLAKRVNRASIFSLLDNAPNQVVGCIILKRLFSWILKLLKLPK